MRAHYDVVVLGAGPAGLAAAISIRREALASVLVADPGSASRERVGESVTPEILVPLARLGLLDEFGTAGHPPCPGSASIWQGDRVGWNDYILSPMGPAWRLHRRVFDDMLARAARDAGAELCWGVRYVRSQPDQDGHRLRLRTPGGTCDVRALQVVDATGPAARFSVHAGACRIVEDRMFALVRYATIRAGQMTMQTLLEAADDGWWYAARLPDGRVVVLFVGEAGTLRRLRAAGAEGFERALSTTTLIGPTLARLVLEAPACLSTPIYSSRLDQPEGHGWIAVGDAASSYDPLVSRGITKGLEDGIEAGRRIAGSADAAGGYGARIAARFRAYADARARLYEMAGRDGLFWQKRRETITHSSWPSGYS